MVEVVNASESSVPLIRSDHRIKHHDLIVDRGRVLNPPLPHHQFCVPHQPLRLLKSGKHREPLTVRHFAEQL
jgi:hypothetical protein